MDYYQTLDFLFSQFAAFHRIGGEAYKPGLDNVKLLSQAFGNPHVKLTTIHIAGTNGKGSTAHSLAAVLQSAGYKTGLFTSPHLVDFRERIRINGEMISEQEVVDFVEKYQRLCPGLQPSFFEITTVMAFDAFCRHNVDIAVIETGLGGRLDSTNIINPLVSIITNISPDHTAFLGNTLPEIAREKAGIIKEGRPVVIGESTGKVRDVFRAKARDCKSKIVFADDSTELRSAHIGKTSIEYETETFGSFFGDLCGEYQIANMRTILETVKLLRNDCRLNISDSAVRSGLSRVGELTHLAGRWMTVCRLPLTICDTGHNPGGWEHLARQIAEFVGKKHIVIGFVNDKDTDRVMQLLGNMDNVMFYFTQPSSPRSLPAAELKSVAEKYGLGGETFGTVTEAYKKALANVVDKSSEMIYVGGSTFVVSDLLSSNSFDFDKHLLG